MWPRLAIACPYDLQVQQNGRRCWESTHNTYGPVPIYGCICMLPFMGTTPWPWNRNDSGVELWISTLHMQDYNHQQLVLMISNSITNLLSPPYTSKLARSLNLEIQLIPSMTSWDPGDQVSSHLCSVRAQEATHEAQVAGSNVSPPRVPETKACRASKQVGFCGLTWP